jgi:hypothetical protein
MGAGFCIYMIFENNCPSLVGLSAGSGGGSIGVNIVLNSNVGANPLVLYTLGKDI